MSSNSNQYCLRCLDKKLDSSTQYAFCTLSIGIIVVCVVCMISAIYITIMQFRYKFAKKLKNVMILMLICALSACYILNEFNMFNMFDKLEGFLRHLLFLICFFHFFTSIRRFDNRTLVYYPLLVLGTVMQGFHLTYFLLRLYYDSVCHSKLISQIYDISNHLLHYHAVYLCCYG